MDILDRCKEIKEKEKEKLNRIKDFFSPLRKRYVSTITHREPIKKKFLGIFPYTTEDSYKTEYLPLPINISGLDYGNVYVRITHRFKPLQGDITTEGEFKVTLFNLPDEEIFEHKLIQRFISHFLCNATPKWMKHEALINHIQDEEKKFYVSDKLDELFETEQFKLMVKNMKGECVNEYVYDYVKTLENE